MQHKDSCVVTSFRTCRAIMGLPRWKRSGGQDFVFFHSHPGFEWDDLATTTAYQDMVCNPLLLRCCKSSFQQT